MPPKKKGISQLHKLAKMAGFNPDELVAEIAERLPAPTPLDVGALTNDVANTVSVQMAAKLEAILLATQDNKVDSQGMVQAVAKVLYPQLLQAIKETSESVFQQNSNALIREINIGLEERLKKNSEQSGGNDGSDGDGEAASDSKGDLLGLLRFALANSERIEHLVNAFRPKVGDSEVIAKGFEKAFADYRMIDGFKRRLIDVKAAEDAVKDLGKT